MIKRREIEKAETPSSEIRSAIEELSTVVVKVKPDVDDDDVDAHIPAKPFLFVCKLVIQVLDKIGPTMTVLRQDIDQNIQRLEKILESDPSLYSNLVEILKKEAIEGNARNNTSCSRALVWLIRSMDFMVNLLQLLVKDSGETMEQAVEEAYNITLKPWHRWISSAAYKVAIKLVPDNNTLMNIMMAKDEDREKLKEEMKALISLLVPLLENIHSILVTLFIHLIPCLTQL
ncbi:glycolipid transfer protein 3-like isoform X1 [Cornus florida]|uniref:glycolipid transfer protein 3-like isoform X1 n=1 Tax=Cornus florida TaxID=4283 RepID=UPI00289E03B1|nr:glycolipid transfer protein 3-like isoform X1 [Cornus florida]